MKTLYVGLVGIGLDFLKAFIGSLTEQKAPIEVIDALRAAIVALEKHKGDVMSRSDWEAQRG